MAATTEWIEEDWDADANHPPFSILNFYEPSYQATLWPQPVDYPFFKRWTEQDWQLYRELVEQKIQHASHLEAQRRKELDSLTTMINELAVNNQRAKTKTTKKAKK